MKINSNNYFFDAKKIALISFISLNISLSYSASTPAQEGFINQISTTSSSLNVSLPLDRNDFLLFYGITNDEEVNAEIKNLRADFVSKYSALKTEYVKSLKDIRKDKELLFPENLKLKESTSTPVAVEMNTKKSSSASNLDKQPEKQIEKMSVQDSTPSKKIANTSQAQEMKIEINKEDKNVTIPAEINLLNEKQSNPENPITLNPSWFKKLKSFVGW